MRKEKEVIFGDNYPVDIFGDNYPVDIFSSEDELEEKEELKVVIEPKTRAKRKVSEKQKAALERAREARKKKMEVNKAKIALMDAAMNDGTYNVSIDYDRLASKIADKLEDRTPKQPDPRLPSPDAVPDIPKRELNHLPAISEDEEYSMSENENSNEVTTYYSEPDLPRYNYPTGRRKVINRLCVREVGYSQKQVEEIRSSREKAAKKSSLRNRLKIR